MTKNYEYFLETTVRECGFSSYEEFVTDFTDTVNSDADVTSVDKENYLKLIADKKSVMDYIVALKSSMDAIRKCFKIFSTNTDNKEEVELHLTALQLGYAINNEFPAVYDFLEYLKTKIVKKENLAEYPKECISNGLMAEIKCISPKSGKETTLVGITALGLLVLMLKNNGMYELAAPALSNVEKEVNNA